MIFFPSKAAPGGRACRVASLQPQEQKEGFLQSRNRAKGKETNKPTPLRQSTQVWDRLRLNLALPVPTPTRFTWRDQGRGVIPVSWGAAPALPMRHPLTLQEPFLMENPHRSEEPTLLLSSPKHTHSPAPAGASHSDRPHGHNSHHRDAVTSCLLATNTPG